MGFWAIYKRELKTYLQSPSTWVVLALLFLIVGMIFNEMMTMFVSYSRASGQMNMWGPPPEAPNATNELIRPVFNLMNTLIMFTIPLLAMRLVAEEKTRGTFELLVTSPIGDWAILLGKYLALVTIGALIILLSIQYPIVVNWAASHNQVAIEWPIVMSCWVGLLLIFATYAAFGVMASSFTENQMIAAVVTLIGLILWNVIGAFQLENLPQVKQVLQELSASQHIQNFVNGVLMLKDFAFYNLATFLFLFIASKTLDARRWRV